MAIDIRCPYCDADIPVESGADNGDEVYCSFCNCPVILQRLDRHAWQGLQAEDAAALKKRRRKEEDRQRDDSAH